MYDKLENLLQKWVSSHRQEAIMGAITVLDRYNAMSAWNEISSILEYATDEPIAMLLDGIEQCLHVGLDNVLAAHTVVMNATIPCKTLTLEGLFLLQNYDDKEAILTLTENSLDAGETLADLLELATAKPWSEYLDHIVSVSPTLIETIGKLYDPAGDDEGEAPFDSADVEKAKRLSAFINAHPQSLVKHALTVANRPLGTPIDILLDDYKLQLGIFEPRAAKQAAEEIVGLALLGDVPFKDFMKSTKRLTDTLYSDMGFITQVDVAMDGYINEVLRNEQTPVPH